MNLILDGLLLGLTLAILLGPIFVALTQTGIQRGVRAGLSVGTGIWISDVLVIITAYFFIKEIDEIAQNKSFHHWMGWIGGLILIIFGIISLLKEPKLDEKIPAFNAKSYAGYWTKGFAVNFFNPFTFVFWISVMTTYVIGKKIDGSDATLLFGSIMFTIIVTDSLKVVLAKLIRKKLTHNHIVLFGKLAGIILITFGVILILRTNVWN
ncbi:MAG TPA: LysE family transporter [Saprospiraceae bacterium]|nr:LysE family transporter [Saprospiraceae bacterium]HMU05822.1 LysE family transporter [Saprospiraceae bacterium]